MFGIDDKGRKVFNYGKENYDKASQLAKECKHFKCDVDEECIEDGVVSCYDCRYRRWTSDSFICMK